MYLSVILGLRANQPIVSSDNKNNFCLVKTMEETQESFE